MVTSDDLLSAEPPQPHSKQSDGARGPEVLQSVSLNNNDGGGRSPAEGAEAGEPAGCHKAATMLSASARFPSPAAHGRNPSPSSGLNVVLKAPSPDKRPLSPKRCRPWPASACENRTPASPNVANSSSPRPLTNRLALRSLSSSIQSDISDGSREQQSLKEDDPLPDIDGLGINGEAVLGNKIIACGLSINGTTLCHFQWVRHLRDGSFFHIPGAAQPEYTITADDVDTGLSLECTPMDDRNRKGEMVQVFVNNYNRITIDQDMNDQIIEYIESGQATFEVKLVIDNAQDLSVAPAVLYLKRSIYELRKVNGKKVVGSEKYASESAQVEIKVGRDTQCAILNNTGGMHLLDCPDNRTRDLLVLTMREFIKAAIDRKKLRKNRLWSK